MRNFFFPKKIVLLSVISGLAIVGISLMKNAMELEDAEQAYYSQWLRWGYDDQPPLYTWLQVVLNKVLGVSKVSFSILRGVIFSSILLALYQLAIRLKNNVAQAISVVWALVLIPTFVDFAFRRLSHTTLLCLVVVATYYCVHRLLQNKSSLNYVLFGLVVGMGLLTKYNYALVLAALGVVVLFDKEVRKVFFNIRMLWVCLLSGILLTPHFIWLFGDSGFAEQLHISVDSKTNALSKTSVPVIAPIFLFFLAFLKLSLPIVVIGLVLLLKKKLRIKKLEVPLNWVQNLFLSQVILLIFVFIAMDVQKIEARWLLPLFIPFLVLLPNYVNTKSLSNWNRYGFYIFLFCILFQVARTPIEKAFKISSSVHFGFEEVSNKLRKNYKTKQWFLPDVTYAGNIRLLNQEREVFALDDYSLPDNKLKVSQGVFVVKNKYKIATNAILTDSIMNFGKDKENLFFYVLRD